MYQLQQLQFFFFTLQISCLRDMLGDVSCNVPDDVSCFPVIFVAYAGHKFFSAGVKGHADYLAMGKVYVNNGHIFISRMNHNLTNTDTDIR